MPALDGAGVSLYLDVYTPADTETAKFREFRAFQVKTTPPKPCFAGTQPQISAVSTAKSCRFGLVATVLLVGY